MYARWRSCALTGRPTVVAVRTDLCYQYSLDLGVAALVLPSPCNTV